MGSILGKVRQAALAATATLLIAGAAAAAGPRFENEVVRLDPSPVYSGGWEHFVGGGLAVLDCDEDGYPDIFAAGGDESSTLLRNATASAGGELSFEAADAEGALSARGVTGAYPLDIDGDGHLDLFVMRAGPNAVLRGLGDCRFEDATEAWNIPPGTGWTTAFAATWEPGQVWPTLAVGNYVDRSDPEGPFGACDNHQLLRPGDSGGYSQPEIIEPAYCALSMLFVDWNGDGQRDLWISNDRHYYVRDGHEQLLRITPALREFGEADGWRTHMLWGMGIAARDLTGDGRPEIAVTSMADQYLFALEADARGPSYAQTAFDRGTTAHRPYMGDEGRPSTGWHAQFGDVDNDGLDDLFIAKGNVEQMPGLAMRDPDNLLMQGPDGRFVEAGETAGVGSMDKGRGAALVDLNRDGLLDLVVAQRGAPMRLYRNVTTPAGHWLKIRLLQPGTGNVNAVGARVSLETGGRLQTRDIEVGGGHAGGQADYVHFGLGDASVARIRVRWPDGAETGWREIDADRHVTMTRTDRDVALVEDAPPRR